MAIRLSGLNSGMDTESIVAELVKAKSTKKDTLEKDQKKLSWKQDAWKDINSKIYALYSKTLSDMRIKSDYSKKTTKSSSDAVSIVTGSSAAEVVQTMKITNLAKAAYLTGAKLGTATKVETTGLAKNLLGIEEGSKFTVKAGDETKEIEITDKTTIGDIADAIRSTGLNCNFDSANQRFYISAKTTGLDSNFEITASDANGLDALNKLGIATSGSYDRSKLVDSQIEALKEDYKAKLAAANKAYNDADTAYNDAVSDFAATYGADAEMDPDVLQSALDAANATVESLKSELDVLQGNLEAETDEDAKAAIQAQIDAKNSEIETAQTNADQIKLQHDAVENLVSLNDALTAATTELSDATAKYDFENDPAAMSKLEADAAEFVDKKISGVPTGAFLVAGEDSNITLNGVDYSSNSNVYEINGLTITLNHATSDEISLTTTQDTNGIYDMIKGFLKEYNELINEMDKLYNAESASKFQMLSDDEKEAMSEDEVKEWEDKIKSALLRKDSTLGNVSSAMKMVMLQGVKMSDGSTLYLSNFGINTLGYFSSADNERNAYHIDGDPDDKSTGANEDKLTKMIASDPDKVAEFFSELAKSLYGKMGDLMERTDYSSAFTVYNDKQLKTEYDGFTDKIKKQEEKINTWEDYYYKKFTRMEKAMADMESKTNALSGMFTN